MSRLSSMMLGTILLSIMAAGTVIARMHGRPRCPGCHSTSNVEATGRDYECSICGERWKEGGKRFGQYHADL